MIRRDFASAEAKPLPHKKASYLGRKNAIRRTHLALMSANDTPTGR